MTATRQLAAPADRTLYAPPLTGARPDRKPSLVRLVLLEIRKQVDTRSGRWLAGLTLGIAVVVNVLMLSFGADEEQTALVFFQLTLLPLSLVLPVLGMLSVTSEWSQRTALTTFVLVPVRERIALAKILASVAWSVVTWLICIATALVCAWVAGAFDLGDGSTHLPAGLLAGGLLYQVLVVVIGVGFGMALLRTPVSIVLYFVLPLAWAFITELVPRMRSTGRWLDITQTTGPLTENAMTVHGWQQLGTSLVLWLLLPLAIGLWRLRRREVA